MRSVHQSIVTTHLTSLEKRGMPFLFARERARDRVEERLLPANGGFTADVKGIFIRV